MDIRNEFRSCGLNMFPATKAYSALGSLTEPIKYIITEYIDFRADCHYINPSTPGLEYVWNHN